MSPPLLAAKAPAEFYEATTATPYLGTTLDGKYAPNATDAIDGDLSAKIKTYLAATNEPITLATYVFRLGSTDIINAVTNSFNLISQQTVTITVRDSTPPAVTVTGAAEVLVPVVPGAPIIYDGKVGVGRPNSASTALKLSTREGRASGFRVLCCLRGSAPHGEGGACTGQSPGVWRGATMWLGAWLEPRPSRAPPPSPTQCTAKDLDPAALGSVTYRPPSGGVAGSVPFFYESRTIVGPCLMPPAFFRSSEQQAAPQSDRSCTC